MKVAGLKAGEESLDMEAISDILHMYRNTPAIKVARESFLSMTLCGPFSFSIPKMGISSNNDMQQIISRYWMPWLRSVFDWIKLIGVCPYYFKKLKGQEAHQVPCVPDIELGYITVYVSEQHEVNYRFYWNHGQQSQEEKAMLWIKSDHSPTREGTIRSALASLLPQYRTILVLQRALETVATQRSKPTHILEYKPGGETAKNDHLTTLVANFGERAAGMSKARQEHARNMDIRVRTSELFKQMSAVQTANTQQNMATTQKLMWTDSTLDQIERADPGFATRTIPLQPDFHYVQTAKAEIVSDLEKHMSSFNMIAAAVMDFALELIQPTGSARTQNVKGSERFENERIKEALNFFSFIARTAIVIAYRKQFEEGMAEAKAWVANRKGGDPNRIADMYPELDVVVDMSCTPMLQYADLRDMWQDGIMKKEDFAHHAFHMRSLPHEQINISDWPDHYPRELLVKPTNTKGQEPPKKKKKETSDIDTSGSVHKHSL